MKPIYLLAMVTAGLMILTVSSTDAWRRIRLRVRIRARLGVREDVINNASSFPAKNLFGKTVMLNIWLAS